MQLPFNGNAEDQSGWGRDGTVHGAVLTTDRFDVADAAYQFDGVNDYIQIDDPFYEFENEITVSWWVKVNNFQVGSGISQSSLNINSMSTSVWLMHGNVDKTLRWYVNDNGTWRVTTSTPPLSSGWHHLVGTANADSTSLYLDGSFIGSTDGISSGMVKNPEPQ